MPIATVTPFQIEMAREAVEACKAAVAANEAGAQADLDRAVATLARYTGGEEFITDHNGPDKVEAEHDPNRARPQAGGRAGNQYGTFKVHYPSEAQKRYIARLISERTVPATGGEQKALEAFRAGTINKRQASDLIEWLLELAPKAGATSRPANQASEKQVAFAKRLIGEKDFLSLVPADRDLATAITEGKPVSKADASRLIDTLLHTVNKTVERNVEHRSGKKVAAVEVEDGMYLKDGVVFKVQFNREGTRTYAKRLVVHSHGDASFEYVGSVHRLGLKAEHKMTLEQAQEFGALYGTCCACGRTLTDENSIEAGIGPVCAKRF